MHPSLGRGAYQTFDGIGKNLPKIHPYFIYYREKFIPSLYSIQIYSCMVGWKPDCHTCKIDSQKKVNIAAPEAFHPIA